MAKIIEFPKSQKQTVKSADLFALSDIEIVRQALLFLACASIDKGIKLTERGNLGRNFVQKFWIETVDKRESPFRPNREEDCASATQVHFILSKAKYVKIFKQSVVITERGLAVLKSGPNTDFYRDLFEFGAFFWEWGYADRYPDYEFIQDGLSGLMNSLWDDRRPAVNAIEIFSKTFVIRDKRMNETDLLKELERESGDSWDGSVTSMIRCLQLRFMRRFCVPFGILRPPPDSDLLIDLEEPFEKTEFVLSHLHDIVCPLIHQH